MLIGYARVSTTDQTLALQQDALNAAGCEQTFTDTASGARTDRPGLAQALSYARPGTPSSCGAWTGWAARWGAHRRQLIEIGERMRDADESVNGRGYTVQQGTQLYGTSGTSDDWTFARHILDPARR